MQVTKRDGRSEPVRFDKITQRLETLRDLFNATLCVDVTRIAAAACSAVHDGISTERLDELTADTAAGVSTEHPDYGELAARILVSNLQKNTLASVVGTWEKMAGLVSDDFLRVAREHGEALQAMVDYSRDYDFDFFGFKTLEKMYLTRVDGVIVERPQHMWLRVAVALWGGDLDRVRETYEHLSTRRFVHASPTLFNAGMKRQQLASCFLLGVEDDSIDGIFEALTNCAKISKYGGGIGLHVSGVRSKGATIRGTNGQSDGLVPMLRVANALASYVNQGGRRKGSIAVYIEPHHPDFLDVISMRRNTGDEHLRARDLFYAAYLPDLFMRRAEAGEPWSFFDPAACPGLNEAWGAEYEALYERYEAEGLAVRQVPAQDVWLELMKSLIETGTPFIQWKDACNAKSNQQNLGTIRCSNLCTEILEFTSPDECAVCLAAGTRVLTSGGLCKIEDVRVTEVYSAYDDAHKVACESFNRATLIDNGVREVVKVTVTGSEPVVCTPDHRFLVEVGRNYYIKTKTYAWKRASELEAGDRITVPHNDPLDAYKVVTSSDIDFQAAGWQIGDGWQCSYAKGETRGVCFGPTDVHAQDVVISTLNGYMDALECQRAVTPRVAENGVVSWACSSAKLAKYLETRFGIVACKSTNKTIPDKILYGSSPCEQASFLGGLFSADGTVGRYSSKPGYVALSSASQQMLYDVQALLRCFGIHSRVVFGDTPGRPGRRQGAVVIHRDLERFARHIGFPLCPAKQAKLGVVLGERDHFEFDRQWSAVVSVEPIGKERVYDLAVEHTHTFVANGMATHNCNLGSLSLPAFVCDGRFDFEGLLSATRVLARNLDRVIDANFYPIEAARRSNLRHRPVGIGVQGLADAFALLRLPFDSPEAAELNRRIFETVYFAAISESCALAQALGRYATFEGSPASRGRLQYDLWGVTPSMPYAWDTLKADVMTHGLRNSLSVAPMPTASTANILGNTEAIEPVLTNMYSRRTLAGEFIVVNKHLIRDLVDRGVWSRELKDAILERDGSVQGVAGVPEDVQRLYKTAWEMSMKTMVDMAADRGAFVCQSQSLNLFVGEPNFKKLSSMYFYAWKRGLKTTYYLRTKAAARAVQVTLAPTMPDCVACSG